MISSHGFGRHSAVSRTIIIVAVVLIVIVAGVYVTIGNATSSLTNSSIPTTTTTSSTASNGGQSSTTSSATSSISSSQSSSVTSTTQSNVKQNITVELPLAPSAPGVYTSNSVRWPEMLAYDGLFTYNMTGGSSAPIPWLATGYSSNPNAQVWTINLRQGVTFSDGTPFNATAVKDGMDNVFFANDVFVSYSTFIRDAPTFLASNQNAANRTIFQNSDGITILSTYSIQFNLSKPEADFISDLTGDYFAVSPSGIAANGGIQGHEVGNTWLYTHSDGTGEYILSSYSSVSNTEVYTANPNWWAISALNMKQPFYKVTINAVTNPTTEELDLRSGAADIIVLPASNVFDFANRTAWQTSGNLVSDVPQVSVWGPVAGAQNDFFALNSNIHTTGGSLANVQPFQNRHIIAALNDAWNASLFIQQDLNGFAIVNPGMMLQGQLGYQNFPSYYPYNLTTAKQNIIAACAQLGCTASNPLQITMTSENDQVSELAGSLLASNINSLQAGVVINFEPVATSAFLSSYIAKSYNIIILEYTGEPPDPLTYPLSMIGAGSAFQTGYSNSSVSALINQAAATPNVTQREQLYLQITEMIAQGGQFIKIGQPGAIFATSSRVGVLPYNSALLNTLPPIAALYPTK